MIYQIKSNVIFKRLPPKCARGSDQYLQGEQIKSNKNVHFPHDKYELAPGVRKAYFI